MTLPNEAWPLFTAVAAALVGGAVTFIATVLSKEQKTSEFRQAWIDALREDLANFASTILVVNDVIQIRFKSGEDLKSIERALAKDVTDIKSIEITKLRVLFRLNPVEHACLISRMNAVYERNAIEESKNPETSNRLLQEFTEEAQRVLKTEWKQVKRGEPIFRATKWISLSVLVVAVVVGIVYAYQVTYTPVSSQVIYLK